MIKSISLLAMAEMLVMSLWFVSSAILPEMQAEADLSAFRAAALATGVQLGFVFGAVCLAVHGTPDRYDPRYVFLISALIAALCNLALLITTIGGNAQILLRVATGFCLAGVYPVGMKIAVGWTLKNRGLVVGLVVGALTLGSASPHAIALLGGADWRITVSMVSALALIGGLLVLCTGLGPHHTRAANFNPGVIRMVWTHRPIRLAFLGYLCHMWELYAFWAWIALTVGLSLSVSLGDQAAELSRWIAFGAIAIGGLMCLPAGMWADKVGKAKIAGWFMAGSAIAAFGSALTFGGSPMLFIFFTLMWGLTVIPDSAQFSALVADNAPPERAGSLMTFQTALGFLLTAGTVQLAPMAAELIGWPSTLVVLGIGPLLGVEAMRRLNSLSD